MKGKMRASSMSLTGWLSLRGDEDEPSVRERGYVSTQGVPVRVHSHDSLILSLSAPNGAARGTALYYLSGPVNSAAIIHPRVYEQVSPCAARCRHRCHALSRVNVTRKRGERRRSKAARWGPCGALVPFDPPSRGGGGGSLVRRTQRNCCAHFLVPHLRRRVNEIKARASRWRATASSPSITLIEGWRCLIIMSRPGGALYSSNAAHPE